MQNVIHFIENYKDYQLTLTGTLKGPYGHLTAFYITKDGGILCRQCGKKEHNLIANALKYKHDPQWEVTSFCINWEESLTCDHCGSNLPSEYGEGND